MKPKDEAIKENLVLICLQEVVAFTHMKEHCKPREEATKRVNRRSDCLNYDQIFNGRLID